MPADRPNLYKSASESTLRVPVTDGTSSGRSTPGENGSMDLNVEVAALSNKLINAINHQTQLDDSLSQTRHELEISRAKVKQLEAAAKESAEMLAMGVLVKKSDIEAETKQLKDRLSEESRLRAKAEEEKRVIERELEGLTAALFGEANEMVSVARQKEEAVDKKNEQLRSQLADTQLLLASHQEQLAELKQVIQQMTAEKEEAETTMSTGTPSTPALGNRASKESLGRVFEALHLSPDSATIEDIQPCPPTALTNFIYPVLRRDVPAYLDFCEVLHSPKGGTRTSPIPRLSSGSFSSIQAMGIGMGISYGSSSTNNSPTGLSGALFGARADKGSDSHPTSPASVGSATNGNAQQQIGLALKETKFYKRVLVEDIEPTLRVDLAPGLSWLARRNVSSAIIDGALQIDPLPMNSKSSAVSCSMCGESRLDEQHARTHQMRTSDSTTAPRHLLCTYCVNRTRSVCDFLAFLRTLKEGMWKCESEGDEKHAWEECVKLRERMFWCRIGGGVIPAFIHRESARNSEEHGRAGGLRPAGDETPRDLQCPKTPELGGFEGPVKLEVPKKRISKELPPIIPEKKASVSETPSPIAPSPIDKELPPPPRMSLDKDSEPEDATNEETIVEKQESAQEASAATAATTSEPPTPVLPVEPTKSDLLTVPVVKTPEPPVTTAPAAVADNKSDTDERISSVPGAW
ncbi:hypothetical protein L873DRAFT_1676276 [Choiromyces venosus 120613-1]|uniref:GDP/GTP exchange factor Sec2 N-terminal domain-containing protein n=1 Tax=Choiromyces venosus 120613-1 TaxID=1336337 RepID=A0A3N4JXA2_9PEZI|nr:hypothetical protein L873DRAFT_1676276 [Choiromyces venosus 120613-1]